MAELRIESSQNARYRTWHEVARGEVREHGRTLVFGARLATEVATSVHWDRCWILPDGFQGELPDVGSRPVVLAKKLFEELDVMGTHYPLLEVKLPDPLPAVNLAATGLFVAVPFQDPVNVGAVVRSAVGLGAAGVFLLPSAANPFHPRSVRASAGAVFQCRFSSIRSLDEVEILGFTPVLLDARGEPIESFQFPARCLLAIGLEGAGVAGLETCGSGTLAGKPRCCPRRTIRLPMEGIESYNAAMAASMAMYEWKRRQ